MSLNVDANTYLPEDMRIPAGITVHHLLAHTSGLYNFYNFEDDFYIGEDRLPYDRKTFLGRWILKQPMNPPGESFNYNNSTGCTTESQICSSTALIIQDRLRGDDIIV